MLDLSRQQLLVIASVLVSNVAIGCWWMRWPNTLGWIRDWVTSRSSRAAVFLILVTATLWVGIFVVYSFPITGDVKLFYQPQGRAALSGEIPNSDFTSWYMPFFPYVVGLVDWIGRDDRAIPLFLTVCFVAGGLLLQKIAESVGETPSTGRALALVGMLNGASWILAIAYQQDETLLFMLTAAAMILIMKGRDMTAGAVLGVGLLTTKVFFGLSALVLLWQASRPRRLLQGGLLALGPPILVFLLLGFDPFRMIQGGVHKWAPPSLTNLLGIIPAVYEFLNGNPWVAHAAVAIACSGAVLVFRRRGQRPRADRMIRGTIAAWTGYLLLSLNSEPTYRILILPWLAFMVESERARRRWPALLFCAYSTALAVHWMLFEDWINAPYALHLLNHRGDLPGLAHLVIQVVLDMVILGSEITWLVLCARRSRDGEEQQGKDGRATGSLSHIPSL